MGDIDTRLQALEKSFLTPAQAVVRDIGAILCHSALTDAEIEELLLRLLQAFRELRNDPNWISQ